MDRFYMEEALKLARQAAAEGEVPVGCVIVRNGQIVGRGRNRRETEKTALGHAELEAIADACANLGGWRLWDCTLYVTLEPCPMCAGAAINARISRIVYAAKDPRAGACESLFRLASYPLECQPACESGPLQEESLALLSKFFSAMRKRTN